jgi:hypothetical protein
VNEETQAYWGAVVPPPQKKKNLKSQDSVFCVMISLGRQSSNPSRDKILSLSVGPEWIWGPPNLLFSGYQGFFLRGLNGWCVRLTAHRCLMSRLRMSVAISPIPYTLSSCVLRQTYLHFTLTSVKLPFELV